MQSLQSLLVRATEELGGEPAKFSVIARNNLAYKSAIKKVWKDSTSSQLILQHTNAFYVKKDERLKKKGQNEPAYVAEVVIDDPVIRSEIDTHREMIFCHLRIYGLNIDELTIKPAKGNMRKRQPFV